MRQIVVLNFDRYGPAAREITSGARGNGKLKWIRLDTDWHFDPAIRSLSPEARALWPVLLAEAGKGHPHGTIQMTTRELSDLAGIPLEIVRSGLAHLRQRGRIAVTESVAGSPR